MPWLDLLKLFVNGNNKCLAPSGVFPVAEFQRIVEQQRERTERSGQLFSIVAFDLGNLTRDKEAKKLLTRKLVKRVRSTDDVGWFDDRHLGVLLYNATNDQAALFAERYLAKIPTNLGTLPYTIHSYPSPAAPQGISQDQRNAERYPVKLESTIQLVGHPDSNFTINLVTRDISATGAFLDTNSPLPIGAEVNVSIVFPLAELKRLEGETAVLQTSGIVVRTNHHGMAINFQGNYVISNPTKSWAQEIESEESLPEAS